MVVFFVSQKVQNLFLARDEARSGCVSRLPKFTPSCVPDGKPQAFFCFLFFFVGPGSLDRFVSRSPARSVPTREPIVQITFPMPVNPLPLG